MQRFRARGTGSSAAPFTGVVDGCEYKVDEGFRARGAHLLANLRVNRDGDLIVKGQGPLAYFILFAFPTVARGLISRPVFFRDGDRHNLRSDNLTFNQTGNNCYVKWRRWAEFPG